MQSLLYPGRSRKKSSLETHHFWQGPASYLNCLHLPAPALFAGVEMKCKTAPPTPRCSDLPPNGLSQGRNKTCCWTCFHRNSAKEGKKPCLFHHPQQAYVLHTVNSVLNICIATSQQTVFFHKPPAKVISHSQAAAILLCPFQGLSLTVTRQKRSG